MLLNFHLAFEQQYDIQRGGCPLLRNKPSLFSSTKLESLLRVFTLGPQQLLNERYFQYIQYVESSSSPYAKHSEYRFKLEVRKHQATQSRYVMTFCLVQPVI